MVNFKHTNGLYKNYDRLETDNKQRVLFMVTYRAPEGEILRRIMAFNGLQFFKTYSQCIVFKDRQMVL